MNQNFKYLCLSIAFILHPEINAQTGAQNFVLSHSYKQKGATIGLDKVNTNIQYLDGLGRPIQTIHMGQAPNGDDAIVPIIYDIYGRQLLNYLPYTASTNSNFQANSSTSQLAYYANNTLNLQGDDTGRPFSESIVENSPQNRSLGMQEPGINSNTSVNIFESNITNEVKRYDAPLTENGIYALGELTKLKITDENGKITESFTDKEGQIICKKVINGLQSLDTYYVYDDNNRLVTVLQPEYQTTANANYFAFQYQYDERSRLIAKKIPGAGWQYMVYDTFDRLRFSQDANQLTRGVWHFVKYDADNRIAYSGEIISNKLQSELKQNLKDNPAHHETRMTSGLGYSLGNSFPAVTDSDIYNETFYDNYTGFAENYINDYGIAQRTNVVGQVTGSRTKILGTNTKLISVIFYDDEYRIIQSVKELYNLGGRKERNSIKYLYDLAPVVAEQKMIQFGTSLPTNSLIKTFTYDHTDRPLSIQESVSIGNSSKTAFTQAYRYNALGQQTQKWTHSADGINYLHRNDQYYNIRGWHTEGNSIFKTDGTEKRHFGYLLDYLNSNKYTNGNIAAIYLAETNEFGYNKGIIFGYDGANRLTSNTGISGYTDLEPTINYDKNGNIQNLTRTGQSAGTYIYTYNGNQINAVNSKSYAYDGNGNTITDGIRSLNLTYNYLNLTSSVSGVGISQTYVFDANGQKHEFTSGATTTKYAGAFEYDASNNVTRVAITDGQAIINNGVIKYQYYHKDHLGNVRSMIDETGKSLQRTDYYPFGLDIARIGNSITNKYLYNGMEKQSGSGYLDYGARFYDSMAPHFLSMDPLLEVMSSWSPYTYCYGNPINFFDNDGMVPLPQIIRFTAKGRGVSRSSYNTVHKVNRAHKGVDLKTGGKEGFNVHSSAEGTIEKIGWEKGGFGRYVIVRHNNGYFSLYAHLQKNSVLLNVGDAVGNGEAIALSGNTGGSDGPHLHLEFRHSNKTRNYFKADVLNPYTIEDLQDLVNDREETPKKSHSLPFIQSSQFSFGNSNGIKPPSFGSFQGFSFGSSLLGSINSFFINTVIQQKQAEEKTKESTTGMVPGAPQ